MVILTSPSSFGRVTFTGWPLGWRGTHQGAMLSSLTPLWWIAGCPPVGRWTCLQLGLCHWPGTQTDRL